MGAAQGSVRKVSPDSVRGATDVNVEESNNMMAQVLTTDSHIPSMNEEFKRSSMVDMGTENTDLGDNAGVGVVAAHATYLKGDKSASNVSYRKAKRNVTIHKPSILARNKSFKNVREKIKGSKRSEEDEAMFLKWIDAVECFQHFSLRQKLYMVELFNSHILEEDGLIVNAGSKMRSTYFIEEGVVCVKTTLPNGEVQESNIGPGGREGIVCWLMSLYTNKIVR